MGKVQKLILLIFSLMFNIQIVHAVIGPWGLGGTTGFSGGFTGIYNFIIGIAGVIFIVMLVIGGIQYLTSFGNEESTTKAKKTLLDAVIGIVVVTLAYVAGTWIITKIQGTITTLS